MLTEVELIGHFVNLDKLNKDSVVVDGGACVGKFCDFIMKNVGCRIIGIEANFNHIPKLRGKCEPIEGALVGRGKEKTIDFYTYPQEEYGNLFQLYGEGQKITVKTINLDDIFKLTPKIDYLKLDIEGEEENLIDTMTIEDASKIDQICMEVHTRRCSIQNITNKLKELGYEVHLYPRNELYATK